jgi:uncharacterized protein (DUF1015 family)
VATLHPFRALRPSRTDAVRVAAPPYDVVNTQEARDLARGNRDSYLHVSRPEIDLPEGTDDHADAVYAKGTANLAEFQRRGVLRADAEPHFYIYAQKMGNHRQVGLVACASVAEYDADVIKKHEKTRADKEDDRTRHIDEMGAHDEPVFLTYRAAKGIDDVVAEVMRGPAEYDMTTQDGVEHRPPPPRRPWPRGRRSGWPGPAGSWRWPAAGRRSVPAPSRLRACGRGRRQSAAAGSRPCRSRARLPGPLQVRDG